MLTALRKHAGNSLVEMMISMTLGLASITAMASLVGHGIGLNSSLLAKSRLDEEMNAVLDIITRELKRAGYQQLTQAMLEQPNTFVNPFENSILLSAYPSEQANSCITYAYDQNKNGVLDSKDTNENYGFRLKNNAIEMRMAGWSCEQNGWHDLTDPKVIKVKQFEFELTSYSALQIQQKQLQIRLHAHLVNYPDISFYKESTVLVQNYD